MSDEMDEEIEKLLEEFEAQGGSFTPADATTTHKVSAYHNTYRLEFWIIDRVLESREIYETMLHLLSSQYFSNPEVKAVIKGIHEHYREYSDLPQKNYLESAFDFPERVKFNYTPLDNAVIPHLLNVIIDNASKNGLKNAISDAAECLPEGEYGKAFEIIEEAKARLAFNDEPTEIFTETFDDDLDKMLDGLIEQDKKYSTG